MSVTLTVTPTLRPFRGFADPALPDGYWAVNASVLMDATGGLASINIRFSDAASPNPSNLWSVEQLLINSSSDSARAFRIDFGNMDFFPVNGSTGSVNKIAHVILNDMGVAISGRAMSLRDNPWHMFLGAARKDVNADLSFDTDNDADANSNSIFAQGFYWGPAAINAPGGPQKPLTSIYSG